MCPWRSGRSGTGPPSTRSSRPKPGDDPPPGTDPDPDRAQRDSPLARATEQFRLRQMELSRQYDEYLGIDGGRPDPASPPPVYDG